jgi:putative lipoprotein
MFFFCAVMVGCSTTQSSNDVIKGTVIYRERIALTPSAYLEVILADVSLADAPYIILNKKIISPLGQTPIFFEINYDRRQILENHSYSVMAKIVDHGSLVFINDQAYTVITKNQSKEVSMVLRRVSN